MTAPVATPSSRSRSSGRLRLLAAVAVVLLLTALAWQVGPLRDALDARALIAWLQQGAQTLGWSGVTGLFVLACSLGLPLSLASLLVVLAFGPAVGAALTLLGASLAGALTYGAGRALGRTAVAQLAGPRLQAINRLAARRGVLAVACSRLVPAAPFAFVNLMLGTTQVSWPGFVVGNLLGILPMVSINALLAPQILAQIEHPSGAGWAGLAALVALLLALSWALRRWLRNA